jgi:hypothetical protein
MFFWINYQEKKMNKFQSTKKPIVWSTTLLLAAILAGCGGGGGGGIDPNSAAAGAIGAACTEASCVGLGKAANYAILSKTGVSSVPNSAVTGNIGVSPAARGYLTGWSLISEPSDTYYKSVQVTGNLYAADMVGGTTSVDLHTAVLDMGTAYAAATAKPAGSCPDNGAGVLNASIPPGVYTCARNMTIPVTNITLAGTGAATDAWVFQITGTLSEANGAQVLKSGGALPQNVFWQVTDVVTMGTTAHMEGVILAQTDIILQTGATINGRLLAQAAVTLDTSTIVQP